MIITCNKCSTRFNLDDSLLKEGGTKVRCSQCKEIFTAYPAPMEPELEIDDPTPALSFTEEENSGTSQGESELFGLDEGDFSDEDSGELELGDSGELELEDSSLEMEDPEPLPVEMEEEDTGLGMDDEFSFDDGDADFEGEEIGFEDTDDDDDDAFDGIEFEPLDEGAMDDAEIEDFSIEELAEENTDSPSLGFEDDVTPLEMADDDQDSAAELPAASPVDDEEEFELEFDADDEIVSESELEIESGLEGPPAVPAATPAPEDDFNEYDEVLDQKTEPEEDLEDIDEETIEIEEILDEDEGLQPPPIPDSGKKKKSSVSAPVLILLLLFLLVAGAYVASIMTGIKIPYLSDIKVPYVEKMLKPPAPAEKADQYKVEVDPKYLNGRYVDNATAGKLFVITGRMTNTSSAPISNLRIKGILSTKSNKKAKEKIVYCGNIISEDSLKTGNIADINKQLSKKTGNHNSNMNIKPGGSIHFMVVFSDLPDELQNFAVEIIQ